jgi:uncharacterized protein (DUF2147 family)
MKKTTLFLFSMFALVLGLRPALMAQHKTDDILGIWYNEERTAKLQIYKENDHYFGKIVWLKVTMDTITGKPRTDKYNPDDKLKNVPLMGLVIVKNFAFDGEAEWKGGTIYDTKNGKTYNSYMKFGADNNVLKLRGYIGISLLGRTTTWFRTKL